jgi:antitoxin HigA-1
MAPAPIHPGEILADELEEIGISATALSRALGVPPNRVTQIINGQRAITAEQPSDSDHGLAPVRTSG